jgi:medium-chain acyl-[acyl-carrier-protein] hydrolase
MMPFDQTHVSVSRCLDRVRLFCFPYAGAGPSIYQSWQPALGPNVKVVPVQLPGREQQLGHAPFDRLIPLVEDLTRTLRPQFDKPFAFFGHSMGALLSFEVARQLRRTCALLPAHMFVSAHRAPHLPDPHPPIHSLSDSHFLEELCRLNDAQTEVLRNPELTAVLMTTLRADFAACETYTYSAEDPLPCPVVAIGGLQDRLTRREELAAWQEQTSSTFMLRMIPGDHFFLNTARSLLLMMIAEDLRYLLQSSHGSPETPEA